MKRIYEYVKTYQTALLSISLALMFSSALFAMIEGFNHVA